jgi:F0F1-type ATP synthase membrane subunit b/b'
MVSEQPQGRRATDTMVGTTPQTGGASRQGSGGAGGQQGGTKGEDVVQQTQEKASQVADQAQQMAGQVVDEAKQQATSQLDSRKNQAVDSLGTVAHALRQTGQQLRQNDQGAIAQYADKAAERVEQFTGQLRTKDVQSMVRDVERYAQQQPAVFLGSAFVLGLLGARFLKSTAQRADDSEGGEYGSDRGYGYNRSYGYDRRPRYDTYRPGYYAGSYRGQYDRGNESGRYGGQYTGGATTGYTGGTTTGSTGSTTTGEYGAGTGERSWSVRGTETR